MSEKYSKRLYIEIMRTSAQAFVLKRRLSAFHKLFEEYENTYVVSHTAKSFFSIFDNFCRSISRINFRRMWERIWRLGPINVFMIFDTLSALKWHLKVKAVVNFEAPKMLKKHLAAKQILNTNKSMISKNSPIGSLLSTYTISLIVLLFKNICIFKTTKSWVLWFKFKCMT